MFVYIYILNAVGKVPSKNTDPIVCAVVFKDVIVHGFEIYQMDSVYIYILCVCANAF